MVGPETRRVMLACSLGGEGHLIPLANAGHALRATGHDVVLLVPPALQQSAQRTGLPYRVGAEPPRAFVDEIWARVRRGPAEQVAGLIDRELFADRCTEAMLAPARKLRDDWQPDLVLREPCEYASAVVAFEANLPHPQIAISLSSIEARVREMVAPILDRCAPGLAAAIGSAPYLTAFPASLDPSPWPDTRRFRVARKATAHSGDWDSPGEGPLLYVTFGTVLGHLAEARAVYRCALEATAGLPVRVLMTIGRATDAASLGPIPDNVRVEQWAPQDAVLEQAAAVVCHGGSGTVLGTLSAGVPLVVCPLFADQPRNGAAVAAAGAGIVVASDESAPGGLRSLGAEHVAPLRAAIEAVLEAPDYGLTAKQIASEIAELPPLETVVERLLS